MVELERHTVYLSLAGSQAHGTAREGSDVDVRGVCIAPPELRLSLFQRFEHYAGPLDPALFARVLPRIEAHPTAARGLAVKTECVIYELSKFIAQCCAANPNALEMLFAEPQDRLLESASWQRLYAARQLFLTKKVRETFSSYALAQLKRIKSHRAWLFDPPAKKPERSDFGLPTTGLALSLEAQNRIELSVAAKLRGYKIENLELPRPARSVLQARMQEFWCEVLAAPEAEVEQRMRAVATHALGLPSDVVAALNAEKRYRVAMKHWEAYQTWKRERNPLRAELERKYGYDTKHAMHLIRLMRMGSEILELSEVRVRRADAAELIAIRDGALSFEELTAQAAELQARMRAAEAASSLPEDVDHARVDRLAIELVQEFWAQQAT